MQELAGMVNLAFRLNEVDDYLNDVVRPKMKWRPSMIVDHNSGLNPHWTKDTTPAQSVQLVKNIGVSWASPPNNWHSGPHWFLGPNLIAVAAWPSWLPGTHSPSWNHVALGTEHSGDFDREPFPDDYRDFSLAFTKKLFKFISKVATDDTYKHHHEDPETKHKHCPGVNFGPKTWWLPALNALTPAEKALDLPHVDYTTVKPVPAEAGPFIVKREGLVLTAYWDVSGWALGAGTQIRSDGTRVKEGDTCTLEEAMAWEMARIASDWNAAQRLISRPISDGLATAILSFCYEFNLAKFQKSTFLAKINTGDLVGAANSLYQWHNETIKGVLTPNDGLKKRRKMEIALFLPDWKESDPSPVAAPQQAPQRVSPPAVGTAPLAAKFAPKPAPLAATPSPSRLERFIRWFQDLVLAAEATIPLPAGSRLIGELVMNNDQISGILRAVVGPLVAWLVAKGTLPAGMLPDWLIPSLVAAATALWSYHSNATGKVNGVHGGVDAIAAAFTAALAARDAQLAKDKAVGG